MGEVRRAVVALAILAAAVTGAAVEPTIPAPRGFVTDTAGVLGADVTARIVRLATELQQKTGAEIAVLTVATTQPLDDFSYGMKVVEAWRPGRKGDDTGILVLVATEDRKLRILVGYGLEGVLPDGLVGEIQDREMIPAFKAGNMAEGVWRGVGEIARRVAEERGVALDGTLLPPRRRQPLVPPVVIFVLFLLLVTFLIYEDRQIRRAHPDSARRRRHDWGGPSFGGSGGGFGGSGDGGFGGFGGGGFGGGGAGRSW